MAPLNVSGITTAINLARVQLTAIETASNTYSAAGGATGSKMYHIKQELERLRESLDRLMSYVTSTQHDFS